MIEPLRPEDLFDLKYIRAARLSPDGRRVVYAVSRTDDNEERFEIWIRELATEEKRRLAYPGNATAPRWSPDGGWIAFVGDERLYAAEFPSLRVSEPLTPQHISVQGSPSWSPDSTRLAASLLERRAVEGPRRFATDRFRVDGLGFLDDLQQCVYQIKLSDKSLRTLTAGQGLCSQPEWSPCGRRILFLASDDAIPFASYSQRLLVVDVDDGEVTEVLGKRWYIESARWLPGGDRIALAAARDSTLTIPTLSLWVVNSSGSAAELRTPGLIGNIGFRINHDMPTRDLTGSNAITVLDQDTAFATVQRGGCVEVWRIALAGDISAEKVVSGERSCIVLDANRSTNVLLFAATDLKTPTELWRATLGGYEEEQLTELNAETLARWPRTTVEPFSFDSDDGTAIEAWFMASAHREGPVPTVLFIHGGPFAATGHAFRYDFHLLTSRGYGVVFANFRGSAGYGEPFVRAIMGDWGTRAYPDHMGAVDAAISRGYADAERLGVWGPSHGGFATCWIVGHTNRFKAAIAEAPSTNFATLYYLTDVPAVYARDLGGRPHEIPDVYRARSPLTYAHRCKTPTLLVHGEDDLRCPIGESEQFHRALRDVGCTTELLRIPGCSHSGDSIGPLSARRAQNEALVTWFQRYL